MTNLTLSTVAAVAALTIAAAGILATASDSGPVTYSVDGSDGAVFGPAGHSIGQSVASSGADRTH